MASAERRLKMTREAAAEELGVQLGASPDEIRKAFRRLALEHHPDRSTEENATARFQTINRAYQKLTRPAGDEESDDETDEQAFRNDEMLMRLFELMMMEDERRPRRNYIEILDSKRYIYIYTDRLFD